MLRLRPYKACDAHAITKWIKNEYAFRQWSADRYDRYPITPDDMNSYYDRNQGTDRIFAMATFDESGLVGAFCPALSNRNSNFDTKRIEIEGFV